VNKQRQKILYSTILFFFILIFGKTTYLQVVKSQESRLLTLSQAFKLTKNEPERGVVYTSDNFPLVQNETIYQLSIYKPNLTENIENTLQEIDNLKTDFIASNSATLKKFVNNDKQKWITLPTFFNEEEKSKITLDGISFQKSYTRFYPEENLAQNILGFIAKDKSGKNIGYGGVEAYYDKALHGKTTYSWTNKDATGKTILNKKGWENKTQNGRNLHLFIQRHIQYLTEEKLKEGIQKYNADSASAIIMDPSTGGILAMANFTADEATSTASQYNKRNSTILDLFEPGSIFKPLTVAIGLESQSINTNYICSECNRPNQIGKYAITNWDSNYHDQSTLRDIIKNSDNVGMSHIIEKIGEKTFLDYFNRIGLNQKTGIDLQGEAKPLTKKYYSEVDLATSSFGQGFAITQIQMIKAFNILANNGKMVKPKIVNYQSDNQKNYQTKNIKNTTIFSQDTIDKVKSILEYATQNGVVNQFKDKDFKVCAKSGTAQIAVDGKYTDSATIASYIGFAPCDQPKFTMIVTINNPRTSPWGSTTAAPIWFDLAQIISNLI
jgi:cell division protein FtsI/penicillin-binding protein 2